ncbi:MAG: XRE family transcriptional regulator, partial [Deltaproteobacteria bacterium]
MKKRKRLSETVQPGPAPIDIGAKIRAERKRLGLSMEALAEEIGISKMKLQRIETGATSPSIVLLSQIAYHLKKPIESFVRDGKADVVHLKKKQQDALSDDKRGFRIIGPMGLISDRITLTYQELEKDALTESHTNEGIEWAYIIEGSAIFEINGEKFIFEEGDSICFNARLPHSTRVIEKMKCVGLFLREE